MIIFDAHLDLAWNAIDWNRDLEQPAAEIRRREREGGLADKGRGGNTVSWAELRRGKVAVVIATLIARLHRPGLMPAFQRYDTMEAAYASAHGQLHYYKALTQQGKLRWLKDRQALLSHVAAWQAKENGTEPVGFILSMEGADPILYPEQVQEWYDAGLRIIGPAHYGPSPYALGHNLEGGLLPQGPALLKEMERVGMILDVTHLSDGCFFEALDIYGGPILASHHNCRTLVPDPRQLSDEQIKRIVARGGVIGAALDAWMLHPGWVRGQTTPESADVRLERMIDHYDHICQLAGNARHIAIGTDLDGGFGREQSPRDLDTIADLQTLPELLRKRGYDAAAIEGIMYGNWLRFFKEAWARN